MSIIAKWNVKRWEISDKCLNGLENISISMSYDTDKKKRDKTKFTIPYNTYLEFGIDVKKEILMFQDLLGKADYLYIGNKKFISKKIKLVGADASEVKIDDIGRTRSASISLSFEEV